MDPKIDPFLTSHQILTHPSGGELWQGGFLEIERLDQIAYDVVFLVARDYQPEIVSPEEASSTPQKVFYAVEKGRIITDSVPILIRANLDDYFPEPNNPNSGWNQDDFIKETIDLGRKMATYISDKKKVLSSCWGGSNRSGFVSAITWKLLFPETAMRDIVSVVRQLRAFGCSNPFFPKLLLEIEDEIQGS